MSKFRASLPLIAFGTALALSGSAAKAEFEILVNAILVGSASTATDLPAPPKLSRPPTTQMDRYTRIDGNAGPKLPDNAGAPKLAGVPKAPQPSLNTYISKWQGEKQ